MTAFLTALFLLFGVGQPATPNGPTPIIVDGSGGHR